MKHICNYDSEKQEFGKKTTAISLQLSLKQCCDIITFSVGEFRQLFQDTCRAEIKKNINCEGPPAAEPPNTVPKTVKIRTPEEIEKLKLRTQRRLVPWTQEQKTLTKLFFEYHIKHSIPPKKSDCESLTEKYPGVFDNKTWPQIKVFVQNEYVKKQSLLIRHKLC